MVTQEKLGRSDGFHYREDGLYCESVPVERLAREFGTPLYLYSRNTILANLHALQQAFAMANPLICYSVKANGNLHILRLLARAGAGFDIVSGGELYRVLTAGGRASKTVFAGVGKTEAEIRFALESGVLMFNVESEGELELISNVAREMRRTARVALRLNPDVEVDTHAHISTGRRENKFGLEFDTAARLLEWLSARPYLQLAGLHMHIGSQIRDARPYGVALDRMIAFCKEHDLGPDRVPFFNLGGGFGVSYDGKPGAGPKEFAAQIGPKVRKARRRLIIEPGRFIVANAGVLLTRVTYVKRTSTKRFIICDAAMSDLIRPMLYEAYHHIWPVRGVASPLFGGPQSNGLEPADVVGPICESGDYLARNRELPAVRPGELLAVFCAGAYGMAMSSNYNARPRACEVLVSGSRARVIRVRESYEDLVKAERI